MAVVRISDKLSSLVSTNIANLYQLKIDELVKRKPDVGDAIFGIMYDQYVPQMAALPMCFFRKFNEIEVRTVDKQVVSVRLPMSVERIGSYNIPESDHVSKDDYHDRVHVHRTERTEEIVNVLLAWQAERAGIIETRTKATKAVQGLFKKHKSLPPAIKDFPPLVDLLPKDARSKTTVPQNKLSSVTMELNPDLKQLAIDIVVFKLFNK